LRIGEGLVKNVEGTLTDVMLVDFLCSRFLKKRQ
jgi:hypothetical protein